MVYFICDGCNETLRKNQVDSHAGRCRRCDSVSCVDCYVSFYGDDYRAHTSCITEAEKYENKSPSGKAVNTKRNPQQEWMSLVEYCAESTSSPMLKRHFQVMATLENIPRKEKQFRNFTSNSLKLKGSSGEKVVSELWKTLSDERQRRMAQMQEKASESHKETEADPATLTKPHTKSKKKKDLDPKKVHKAMKKTLKKAPNKSMKVKQLRKILEESLSVPKESQKLLKQLVKDAPKQAEKEQFSIEGKIVRLS